MSLTISSLIPRATHPFFQVINIPTKVNKGIVEIITLVELIKKGGKVGSSEVALLAKLGIKSFSYRLVVLSIYDNGSIFIPEVLNLTEDDIVDKFYSWCFYSCSAVLGSFLPNSCSYTFGVHQFLQGLF
ncbi:60S acidic ribosomal protein P0-like [Asparagus officinalis]|uniref:60S acidic ribosomal protein P0-like n=1 Tax=Asparagus officinalis TaxID=4686 RepID=UPI00098E399F|nr:60S acidic ribosomal protein P0-like [Asparagus officinalis]